MPRRSGPLSDSNEATLTTAPAPRATMPGSTARISVTGVVTWMATTPRHDLGIELGERPVAGEAGVVDEQLKARLVGDARGDAGDVGGGGEVGDEYLDLAPVAAPRSAASASRRSRRRATTIRS